MRRVFKVRVDCVGVPAKTRGRLVVGQAVLLQRAATENGIDVALDERTILGRLAPAVASQVEAALGRGQAFTATIENINPISRQTTWVYLKVEYLLERGQPALVIPKAEPKGEWVSFYTKIAGATHRNPSGSERQELIRRCRSGERLQFVREPDNPEDSSAVKVLRADGEQLGHLPSGVARSGVASRMDRGFVHIARISKVTGGGKKLYGANLEITFWKGPLELQPSGEPPLPPLESSDDAPPAPRHVSSSVAKGSGCLVVLMLPVVVFFLVLLAGCARKLDPRVESWDSPILTVKHDGKNTGPSATVAGKSARAIRLGKTPLLSLHAFWQSGLWGKASGRPAGAMTCFPTCRYWVEFCGYRSESMWSRFPSCR